MSPSSPPPSDLAGFPALGPRGAAAPQFRIWRAVDPRTQQPRDPWWSSSLPSTSPGRFDLPAPAGTCYLSDRRYGAWLEVFRGCGLVDRADVEPRRLLVARPAGALPRLADLRAAAARPYGVTADLTAGGAYDLSHRWARALHLAAFDGVSGTARHDPTHRARTTALFGVAGSCAERPGWVAHSVALVDDADLLDELVPFGTGVAGRPWDVGVVSPPAAAREPPPTCRARGHP